MAWWNRKPEVTLDGSALFRGRWAPRPDDFRSVTTAGVRMGRVEQHGDAGWSMELEHPTWGTATLHAMREPPLPSGTIVDMDARLTDEEKADIRGCQFAVAVSMSPRSGNVLLDRKDLLRFLFAVMGSEGVAAVDHVAQSFWSRDALEEELAHDAELDIDSIYTMHLLYDPERQRAEGPRQSYWLHSHGLKEIGFWDFDVLNPSPDLMGRAHELLRALAFAVVEGTLTPGGEAMPIIQGADIRAVDAKQFVSALKPEAFPDYRQSLDDEHLKGHAVICEPSASNWLGRLMKGTAPAPSRFLQREMPDEVLIPFSHSATDLMARRARGTIGVLRAAIEEFGDLQLPALVKLGYQVDGGGELDREHLWFQVHAIEGDTVDATLINSPFHIARMKVNDRGTHSLELLSDWTFMTPIGNVSPRHSRTIRTLRVHKDKIRQLMREHAG